MTAAGAVDQTANSPFKNAVATRIATTLSVNTLLRKAFRINFW
jgi:hypothetical protein